MNKAALALALIFLTAISSCSKSGTVAQGGTWSFKGVGYTSTAFSTTYGAVNVSNQSGAYSTNYSTLSVNFYGGIPTTQYDTFSHSYHVVNNNVLDSTTQVSIALSVGGNDTIYRSTGGNGSEYVNVKIYNGNISITGSGLELDNIATGMAADSGVLNLNIVQP
jgi:hypothetical protein